MSRAFAVLYLLFIIGFAPLLAPYDALDARSGDEAQPPTAAHALGTDALGRDVLSRLLVGGRVTVLVAGSAALLAAFFGVLLGVLAASYNRATARMASAFTATLLAFPGILLAFVVAALIGSGPLQIAVGLGVSGAAPFARVMRIVILQIQDMGYIEAARSLGGSRAGILWRHIRPNLASVFWAQTTLAFAWSLLNGAGLSFLGLAGELAQPDWGVMLAESRGILRVQPVAALAAGCAIVLTVLVVNRLSTSAPDARRS